MKSTCVVRTNKIFGGGSIYEHETFNAVSSDFTTTLWEYDQNQYKWLRYKKLKITAQSLLEHPPNTDYLVTNNLFIYGLRLNRFKKKILILHHIDQNFTHSKFTNRYIEKLILKSLNKFDAIVAVSDYWKSKIKLHTEKPVYVIRNSFDVSFIDSIVNNFEVNEFKYRYQLPENKPIIYCGNGTYAKGIDIVSKNIDTNKFFIVTSGRKDIDIGQHHLSLSYSDYLRLLSICDATVLLSRLQEGWNRIAHESILCGTPVIGKKTAGLGELIKISAQTAIKDYNLLNQTIDDVISNNIMLSKKGKSRLSLYDLQYFKNEWIKLLTSL